MRAFVVLLTVAFASSAHAEERFLSLLFGPGSPETARQGARAAAGVVRHWSETPGAVVELRRAGSPDALSVNAGLEPKELEQALIDTALQARGTDPAAFLTALDAAAQAAALHSGTRLLVALLNSPPLSSEAEKTVDQIVEFCRAKGVRVIVLDILEKGRNTANAALEGLATKTGGIWLRKPQALEASVLMVAPVKKGKPEAPAGAAAAAVPAPAAIAPPPAAVPGGFEIPVHTRFIRTSGSATMSVGSMIHETSLKGSGEYTAVDRPQEANDSTGPLRGLVMVESPLNALRFETDATTDTYQARVRITSIVRNAKGEAVWTGRKEVNLRGPSAKLDRRRQGSLFFMRGVTLPGGQRYTLEAKIEDLLAESNGAIQTPLRTSPGAPGLMASDALVVRPFSGSADRFEADQVFSYEGEALSPVLNPVFPAGERIHLQFYLIIYPDIGGAQPELSLELLRDGRVVSRMPLQFKTEIGNRALEGKFGTLGGKGSAMVGGRSREFPYLGDMKGAEFSPGTYEGIISVRQGRNVITRNISFQVLGKTPDVVGGPAVAAGSPADADAGVVLPEIAPATIDSSGLAMDRGEQIRLWDEAAKNALGYSSHLPNFRCTQETHRFTAPLKTPDQLKEGDSFKDELMYEDGKETYLRIEIDGAKPDAAERKLKAVHSRGEFGSMLRGLFEPDAAASYKWAGRAMALGVLCQVFEVEVSKQKSNLALVHKDRREQVGYSGRVFIDEETGLVRRLDIQGVDLPKDFVLQSPSFSLEYGMVRIGSDDFLLPLRSVLQVRQVKQFVRNETVFRDYRRFEASTDIKFHNK